MTALRALTRFSRSLYARLALVYLASLLLMSLATAWIAVSQFNHLGREWLQRNQLDLAAHLTERFAAPLARGTDSAGTRATVADVERINPSLSIYVLDESGRVVGSYGARGCARGKQVATAPIHALLSARPMLPVYIALPCRRGRYVFSAAPVHYGADHAPGYLFVVLETDTHMSMTGMWQTSSISRSLMISGLVALVLSAIVGLLLFARLTRRFSRLTGAVQRFANGDYGQRIAAGADDEIGRAARAFNDMAATLEAQVNALRENDRQRRELVANLSHDFRTPLTALRGYAEQLRADAAAGSAHAERLDALLANVARLTRLADQLSLLSRVDIAERALHVEAFPLAELVHDIAGKFRSPAEAAGITLVVDGCDPRIVSADLELVDRALSNLVDNALRATDAGGRVVLAAEVVGVWARVSVTDTGVGIPAEEISLVTQRFYRTRGARERGTGSGLGLAIVAEICSRHDTRLVLNSDDNGTEAYFDLPLA